MYIFRTDNRLEIPVSLYSFKGTAEEIALVDSGATENFIDQETIKRLKLGTKKLSESVKLRNIDGSFNKAGSITHYIDLLVSRGNKKVTERFYVTNLGSDRLILGYPWLRSFNPEIDWPNCQLIGPKVKIETLLHGRYPRLREIIAKQGNGVIPTQQKADQVDLLVRDAELTNEEDAAISDAIKDHVIETLDAEANPSKDEPTIAAREAVPVKRPRPEDEEPEKSLEELVPQWCHPYIDVFTEKEAIDLPPHREWDH